MSSKDDPPADAPPSYAAATGSSTSSKPASSSLQVPDNGISNAQRRSMEDEQRPLPAGWVRQFDPVEHHQFFVDTRADPPRSIWHHPYDDDDYLSTLSSEQREQIQEDDRRWRDRHEHSGDEGDHKHSPATSTADAKRLEAEGTGTSASTAFPELPPRPSAGQRKPSSGAKPSFGERFKDKVTGTTHDQRVEDRKRKAEQERMYYEAHMRMRQAMQLAMQTGQPQPMGQKDRDGRDIYVTPPAPYGGGGYGGYGGYGGGYGGYQNANYYSPYQRGAPYYSNDPSRRYITPQNQYYRPGLSGAPLAAGAGAGLLGGLLLGGLLF